jgi:tetratricopeptide (TPR) repeat protein
MQSRHQPIAHWGLDGSFSFCRRARRICLRASMPHLHYRYSFSCNTERMQLANLLAMNPLPTFGSTDDVVVKENMQNNINSSSSEIKSSDDILTTKKAPAVESSSLPVAPPVPTYQSSEASDFYQSAKALLKSGDFEDALSTIEEGIAWTQQQLQAADIDSSLHESMAPFHYLYGTTLLYSIEESNDTSTMQEPLTTVEAAANDDEGNETVPTDNENDDAPEAPSVEDMEIAWEHLETARTILEHMMNCKNVVSDALRADLAQVLLRAGDLQRLNGAYAASVADYTTCLSYYDQNQAPLYTRKRADVHCNLGAVYFNLVVEAKTSDPASSSSDNGNVTAAPESERKMAYHRGRGYHHYFECARTLVGMIAHGLGVVDPKEWFEQVEKSEEPAPCTLYDVESEHYPQFIRTRLRSMRQFVSSQVSGTSEAELSDEVQDCLALLEEIQETIDEAETSEQGVVEATAMKEEITALVAAQCEPHEEAFGSATAAASTAVAQTIAVVRKKKPRPVEEVEEVKCPADPAKRIKSSE